MGLWGTGGGVLPTGKGWKGNGNLGAHPKDRRLRYQGRKSQSLRLDLPCSWNDRMYQRIFNTHLNGTLQSNFGSVPLEPALSMPLQLHGLGRSMAGFRDGFHATSRVLTGSRCLFSLHAMSHVTYSTMSILRHYQRH